MHEKTLFKTLSPFNWACLILSAVLITVCVMFQISGKNANYNEYFPFYWVISFVFINLGFIPALYEMGQTRKAFRYQVWYGVFAIALYLLGAFYCLQILEPKSTGPYLMVIAMFSAASAALGWVIHVQLSNRTHRKTHTLNLLMQSRVSTEYQGQIRALVRCFPHTSSIEKKHLKYVKNLEQYKNSAGADTDDGRMVDAFAAARYLLNYFEFLAAGIEKEDLDEDLLYECLSGIITGMHKRCHEFIKFTQVDDEKTFINLDNLVRTWTQRRYDEHNK